MFAEFAFHTDKVYMTWVTCRGAWDTSNKNQKNKETYAGLFLLNKLIVFYSGLQIMEPYSII